MTGPTLAEIDHFLPISPTLATAGQPTAAQFQAVRQAGYEVVINLALPTSDHAIAEEPDLVRQLGMVYVAIPVVWESPTLDDLEQFFAALAAHSNRKVLVHCAKNMRVSAFVYLYRVLRLGTSPQQAQADLAKIWQPNPTWAAFMQRALAHYGAAAKPD